jgi:hypothetical protein
MPGVFISTSSSSDEVVSEGVADPARIVAFWVGGKGVSAPPRRE